MIRRLARGDKVYEAHRSHGYQHATVRYKYHGVVTMGVGVINVFYLLPLALLVGVGWLDGALGLILAYLPLMLLVWKLKAGVSSG
ncbi:hypothetical protein D3C76_1485910 [compost metagenome]